MEKLRHAALNGTNTFATLLECARVCSLGYMTEELDQLGGKYWRNV